MAKFDSLIGKVVVITGGAKNLGGLLSKMYASEGAKVLMHYHSKQTQDEAKNTLLEIQKIGGQAALFQADLTNVTKIQKMFQTAVETYGTVDIAINTVGKVLRKPIAEISEKEFDEMDKVNSKVAYFFIKEAEKHMNNNGKIITLATSLLAAYTGYYSTYAGGKAPVEEYTRAASKEFMHRGISVNTVAPGPMDTPFFYGQETDETVAFHKSQTLHNQLTKIEDIAPIIRFLTLEGWWINGQIIFANGGYTTR
ncbi:MULTISPECIES: SDR family oxidoreductase [Bacillus cereus group]|uniref:SDR family oxidoreductase n=1 Tax=Bacillus cereus group TaxID=86661 RepID=UPI000D994AB7|nr:SDR family oxidoreductase [Bacillus cereus]MCU4948848.1 SDR family oxidoreductase [Bacillus cereus]SPT76096.1 short-chain dehydrogenase/reductase SDR [Bacillus cereus]